jgi:hypothetical protein
MISAASHSSALLPCATSSPLTEMSAFSKNLSLSTLERVAGRLWSTSSMLCASTSEGGIRNSLPPTISGTGASGSSATAISVAVSIMRNERRSADRRSSS